MDASWIELTVRSPFSTSSGLKLDSLGRWLLAGPHNATEVYVTGTFDDWGKTIRLDKKGDVFEKEVQLSPTEEKLHYKFVVDGTWTTDTTAPEEDDGSNNINNVLYPDQIHEESKPILQNGAAAMSGVTPDSTTAALAGGVPKDSGKNAVGNAAISSAAPGSTTADLAKNAPFEQRANVPGTFPATPGLDNVSVNPIPASSGTGNPISLKPGEKVPDPSTFNSNTIQSTARTDQAGYEQDASHSLTGGQARGTGETTAAAAPPTSKNLIPESSLPMGEGSQGASDPVTIQSAAPTSTTAGLAAGVPLESQRNQANGGVGSPVSEVPDVVKSSLSEAHQSPEAATSKPAVDEKKDLESELQKKVPLEESSGAPAPTVTAATSDKAPGATADQAHRASAATEQPPAATGPPVDTTQLSPRATTPTTEEPTVTTGPEETAIPKEQGPGAQEQNKDLPATPADQAKGDAKDTAAAANNKTTENASKGTENGSKDADKNGTGKEEKKKRNRASGFFHKLKEKLK
ncbi:hypothetical protein P170DRAFT_507746 [Aspergillus steynii IBT 23096]|uniref:AMP-activated protein kinase glycogen-binding domain-containing protein n=1 Tax=Aspergillus steynii IBT 23096 TaxID=1392250 RepID=A0A2I2GJG7_9EURO|nr:uncharacterized protein P170DRAFT_507746 [Aspergillus steynii IBT 23096]PLB53029.1 hypothetical protein P170DRAFT_507746 [Aspergillus steynii IBT 23096]